MFKLVLEKAEEAEIKLPTSTGTSKKHEFQKNIYFCFIDYAKAFDCVDHNKLWKILKYDTVKELQSIRQQTWKTQQWLQDWKRSVFIPIPKKSNAKESSNYRTTALISHASKVMLKILQSRLQQYVNCELPDVQAGFRKGRGTRDQLPTSAGSSKKQESSRKTSISSLLTMPKPLTVWITINCGNF